MLFDTYRVGHCEYVRLNSDYSMFKIGNDMQFESSDCGYLSMITKRFKVPFANTNEEIQKELFIKMANFFNLEPTIEVYEGEKKERRLI
jgi:hypothetical protein